MFGDVGGFSAAAGAGHVYVEALCAAAASGGGSHAEDALFEEASFGVGGFFVDAVEFVDFFVFAFAGAFVADGFGWGEDGAFGWEVACGDGVDGGGN